ncbi:hypothetical protein [Amycolatopsis sp. NPDC004378]
MPYSDHPARFAAMVRDGRELAYLLVSVAPGPDGRPTTLLEFFRHSEVDPVVWFRDERATEPDSLRPTTEIHWCGVDYQLRWLTDDQGAAFTKSFLAADRALRRVLDVTETPD